MTDRIHELGTMVFLVPEPKDFPTLVAKIARHWAELHEADPALALELARKLPTMQIRRGS